MPLLSRGLDNRIWDRYFTLDTNELLCQVRLEIIYKGAIHAKNSANDN